MRTTPMTEKPLFKGKQRRSQVTLAKRLYPHRINTIERQEPCKGTFLRELNKKHALEVNKHGLRHFNDLIR